MRDERHSIRGQDPAQRFERIGAKLERWLVRAGVALAALLILFQLLLRDPSIRSALIRVDSLEGARVSAETADSGD